MISDQWIMIQMKTLMLQGRVPMGSLIRIHVFNKKEYLRDFNFLDQQLRDSQSNLKLQMISLVLEPIVLIKRNLKLIGSNSNNRHLILQFQDSRMDQKIKNKKIHQDQVST
jgi:hypothetical protein